MNKRCVVLLLIFIVCLISISAVSAAEDNVTGIYQANQGMLEDHQNSVEIGSFPDLNEDISKIPTGGTLTLKKDYAYNFNDSDYKDGIRIAKDNIVIDGNGHAIDGAGQARIFHIVSSNVTLKNINFVNGHSNENGGAVYVENAFSDSKINSTFINNTAYNGGAIYFNGVTTNVKINSYFEENEAVRAGGAIYAKGESISNTIASQFYSNRANAASGGAIFFYTLAENNLFESIFRYNYGVYGAGIFFYNKANDNEFKSDFRFNVAESCGGAIFFHNTTNNNEFAGHFINNSALGLVDEINGNGGAITFKETSTNSIFSCDFINNTAARNGGGVNYRETSCNITFNSNFINNSAENGGGTNFFENFENIVFNGEFIGNSATYGGAIAAKSGVIKNTSFENNHAETGGAIYFDSIGEVINCKFNNNTIIDEYGDGGAIYFNDEGTIVHCNFTMNTAIYYGGAVYFWKDGKIESSIFKNNEAQNGGSLYIHGNGEVKDCNFTNNNARTGGAIEFWGSGIINCSDFSDNVAEFSGGAVYLNRDVKISDCSFRNNAAEGYAGGAIYIFSIGEVVNSKFINNAALCKGGSIYFNSNGTATNVSIADSKTEYGGAIYFNKNGTVGKSAFRNNSADDGGAILAHGDLTINDSIFNNNTATLGTNHIRIIGDAAISLDNVTPQNIEPFRVGHMTISDVCSVTYGETVEIAANVTDEDKSPLNKGVIYVVIDGKAYCGNMDNGSATIAIPNLNAGKYEVNVTYNEDGYLIVLPATFEVLKQKAVILAEDKSYSIANGGKYSIILKDAKGNNIAGKEVDFKLDGKNIGSAATDAKGVATINLTSKILKTAGIGKKELLIQFVDSNYNDTSKTVKITVNKEKGKVGPECNGFKKANTYTILKNNNGNAVKTENVPLKFIEKIFKVKTHIKGKYTFEIKLTKNGKFDFAIKCNEIEYSNNVTDKVKITISGWRFASAVVFLFCIEFY